MRDGETANDVPANTPSNASTAAPMTATGRKMTLPIEPASGSVATLLRDFFDAHAARSGAYERWNARYASTLRGEMSESAFVGVTTEVTGEMKELSEKVRLRLRLARARRMSTDDASRRFYPSRKV
jgi:hypothetical protein